MVKIGWAKRWFQLSPSGVLSYSTSPGGVTRGSIQIMLATISSNPEQRLIHIDSGTMLYHLKTLTMEDHERWTAAFRAYRTGALEYIDEQQPQVITMNGERTAVQFANAAGAQSVHELVEKGIRGSTALMVDIAQMDKNIKLLLDRLRSGASNKEILDFVVHLDKDFSGISFGMAEQQRQWRIIQDSLTAPDKGPVVQAAEESLANLTRSASVRSSLSEQFFDAEDIILSGGDDESFEGEEEGNDDSSDEDDGKE